MHNCKFQISTLLELHYFQIAKFQRNFRIGRFRFAIFSESRYFKIAIFQKRTFQNYEFRDSMLQDFFLRVARFRNRDIFYACSVFCFPRSKWFCTLVFYFSFCDFDFFALNHEKTKSRANHALNNLNLNEGVQKYWMHQ